MLLVFGVVGVWGTSAGTSFAQDTGGRLDEVAVLLPAVPPPGFGLGDGATFAGTDGVDAMAGARPAVAEFLDEKSRTVTRVWADRAGSIAVAVSITKYPYGIFAATALGAVDTLAGWNVVSSDAIAEVPDVVSYVGTGERAGRVATAFRRGDVAVIVVGAARHRRRQHGWPNSSSTCRGSPRPACRVAPARRTSCRRRRRRWPAWR